jgi:basic membrane protein A
MLKGEVTRFTIFTGPIYDNKGVLIVPMGVSLTQSDLEGLKGIPGRPDCAICMNWLAEGFEPAAEIPPMNP